MHADAGSKAFKAIALEFLYEAIIITNYNIGDVLLDSWLAESIARHAVYLQINTSSMFERDVSKSRYFGTRYMWDQFCELIRKCRRLCILKFACTAYAPRHYPDERALSSHKLADSIPRTVKYLTWDVADGDDDLSCFSNAIFIFLDRTDELHTLDLIISNRGLAPLASRNNSLLLKNLKRLRVNSASAHILLCSRILYLQNLEHLAFEGRTSLPDSFADVTLPSVTSLALEFRHYYFKEQVSENLVRVLPNLRELSYEVDFRMLYMIGIWEDVHLLPTVKIVTLTIWLLTPAEDDIWISFFDSHLRLITVETLPLLQILRIRNLRELEEQGVQADACIRAATAHLIEKGVELRMEVD